MTREEGLASDEFERALTEIFQRVTTAAVKEHHRAGLPVSGLVDGKWIEIRPEDVMTNFPILVRWADTQQHAVIMTHKAIESGRSFTVVACNIKIVKEEK